MIGRTAVRELHFSGLFSPPAPDNHMRMGFRDCHFDILIFSVIIWLITHKRPTRVKAGSSTKYRLFILAI